MKRCWLAVLPLAIAIVAWSWLPGGEHGAPLAPPPMVSQADMAALHALVAHDLDGRRHTLDQWRGTAMVLNFWATWCGPCKKELDAYAPHYEDWSKKYGAQLLAISIDDIRGQAKIKPMVSEKKWPYIVLVDSNSDLQRQLGFNSIPQLYMLDQKGNIVYQASGYVPGSEKELEAKMASLK